MRLLHGPLDDARDAEVSDAYGAGPVDEDVASFDVSASGCLFQNGSNDGLLEDTSAVWLRQVLR